MGFIEARKHREWQERAKAAIKRRIKRRENELAYLRNIQRDLETGDWGAAEEQKI
jgi:hypothetical protein